MLTVSVTADDLPAALLDAPAVRPRVHRRGDLTEVRFDWRDPRPALPVWLDGRVRLARWGDRDRRGKLPPCGLTWRGSIAAGKWAGLVTELATVPATYCRVGGVWYRVREGVEALVVRVECGDPVAFLIVEEATRYFRVMTRSEWMPALVNETI